MKEFEIEMLKIESVMDTIIDSYKAESDYAIAITESTSDLITLDQLITEADSKFSDKVKKVLTAIADAFKALVKKIKEAYIKMLVKKDVKKHLKIAEKVWLKQENIRKPLESRRMYKANVHSIHEATKGYIDVVTKYVGFVLDIANATNEKSLDRADKRLDKALSDLNIKAQVYLDSLNHYKWTSVGEAYREITKEFDTVDKIVTNVEQAANKNILVIQAAGASIADDDEQKVQKLSILQRSAQTVSKMYSDLLNKVTHHPYMAYNDIAPIVSNNPADSTGQNV